MKPAARTAATTFLMLAMCSCSGGSTPPAPRPLDWTQDSVDHSLPYLEPPLTVEQTRDLRAGFDWASTVPLSETDADGNPALYYAMVYVTDREQLELLELLSIPSQTLPLFAEERTQWAGRVGVLHNRGDYEGLFRFAVVPGLLYNALRSMPSCSAMRPFPRPRRRTEASPTRFSPSGAFATRTIRPS